jgi:hypothetical protein
MKRHHFRIVLVPAAILDVRCVDADYKGHDADYFEEREVELDPTVSSIRKIGAREIEFSSSDPSVLFEQVDEICHWSALDRPWVAELCRCVADEEGAIEEADGIQNSGAPLSASADCSPGKQAGRE